MHFLIMTNEKYPIECKQDLLFTMTDSNQKSKVFNASRKILYVTITNTLPNALYNILFYFFIFVKGFGLQQKCMYKLVSSGYFLVL